MKRLILASGSRYRAHELKRLGLAFDTIPADIDETPEPGERAGDLVMRLATVKSQAVWGHHPDSVVIGSDQVATLDGAIIGKPGTAGKAFEQLRRASGRAVCFHTGLTVLDTAGQPWRHTDTTTVHFRTLDDAEIRRYITAENPLDCAGSFKCEGLGISLFDAIETRDPSALIGLPLIALAGFLRQCGFQLP